MKLKINELSLTEVCAAVRSAYIEAAENSGTDFNYSENFFGQIEILQRKSAEHMKKPRDFEADGCSRGNCNCSGSSGSLYNYFSE